MKKMKNVDYKQAVSEWIKTHPTPAKVIVVAVLVVLFCVIFVTCKGKDEAARTPKLPEKKQTVVPPAPAPAPDPGPENDTVTDVETPAPELSAEHAVKLPNNAELKLIRISKGSYIAGSPTVESGRNPRVESLRQVNIADDFYIGVYEVTQAQYLAVTGQNPSRFKGGTLPVENVTWDDAVIFCEKLNASGSAPEGWKFSLPSSEQWEYACRAGSTTPFFWGKTLNGDKANCYGRKPYGTARKGAYLKKTAPVGSYSANAWGIYDMHGNVWEWSKKTVKGRPVYEIRGGSWATAAKDCRSAVRYTRKPSGANQTIGFRVILEKADY